MVCKKVPGKIARHHVLMTSFGEPSVLPGSQLSKSPLDWTADKDGKRTDRLTLIPRQARWPFVCLGRYSRQPIIAATYVDRAATDAGTVADMAATRKTEKYSTLSSAYRLQPVAVENLGVFSSTTLNIISELGRRICVHTGDARETSYLFAFLSRNNASTPCFCATFLPVDLPDL